MPGFSASINMPGIDRLNQAISKVAGLGGQDRKGLLDAIGGLIESQTQVRIEEEKASPDGKPWPEWSDDYAKTRHSGQSLLQNEGDLVDDLSHRVIGTMAVETGVRVVYGPTQQFGDEDRGIPAREFLGYSEGNVDDLVALCDDYIAGLTNGIH